MKISTAFPSKYLRSDDIPEGKRIKVVISKVELEAVGGDDNKPVMYFQGKQKGAVCNRTNFMAVAMVHGKEDTGSWIGKSVYLSQQLVNFKGQMVPGLKIDPVYEEQTAPVANTDPGEEPAFLNEEDPPF